MDLQKAKIFETILVLSSAEREKIPDFVNSPIFYNGTGKETILQLYQILRGEAEKLLSGKTDIMSEEMVYQTLYPELAWNRQTFDPLKSKLLKIVNKAIIFWNTGCDDVPNDAASEEVDVQTNKLNNEIDRAWAYLKFCYKRKWTEQFKDALERLKILCSQAPFDLNAASKLHLAYRLAYDLGSKNEEKGIAQLFEIASARLDAFFLLAKIDLPNPNPIILSNELSFLKNKPQVMFDKSLHGLLKIANQLGKLWQTKDEADFDEYMKLLEENETHIPTEFQKDFYALARNFCSILYRSGQKQFGKKTLEIYKKNLEAGFLYRTNGVIKDGLTQSTFINIVLHSIRSDESEWALQFIEENGKRIIAKEPYLHTRFYNFCLAQYHFYKKNYRTAANLLEPDLEYFPQQLAARILEIKIHYDNPLRTPQEHDHLENRLAAFKAFIYRNKEDLAPRDKKSCKNFLKYMNKLVDENPRKHEIKKRIWASVQREEFVAEREWLMHVSMTKYGTTPFGKTGSNTERWEEL